MTNFIRLIFFIECIIITIFTFYIIFLTIIDIKDESKASKENI